MNPILDGLIQNIAEAALEGAKEAGSRFLPIAIGDAKAFVADAGPKLVRYFDLLAEGKITRDEFDTLVKGLADLAAMRGLTEAGLALVEVEKTKNSILKAVTSVISSTITKLI